MPPDGGGITNKRRLPSWEVSSLHFYIAFTHDVAPKAVSTADAIDAIICTTNLKVSFFVIMLSV